MSTKKKVLITGILGQDGSYLAHFLLQKNYKVYGLAKHKSSSNFANTDYFGITKKIEFISGDITNQPQINKFIAELKPDELYNFAAQSFGVCWDNIRLTTEVNALGVLNLLEAVRLSSPQTKFFQASSSELYGRNLRKVMVDEKSPLAPQNPYAIAKLYAHNLVINYREHYKLFCASAIFFNHESPIRGLEFVTRKISNGVARIKLGLSDSIELGNINTERDWGFAGDFVEAAWLMLQQKESDDYIVSTGTTHTLKEFLEIAFHHVGLTNWERFIKVNPDFVRPRELLVPEAKPTKAKKVLGWKPRLSFKNLVTSMVDTDLLLLRNK